MKVTELKKRLLRGLIRQEYFYIPVTENKGTGVDIVIELEDDDGNPAYATGVYLSVNRYTYPCDIRWNNEEHTSCSTVYTEYNKTYVFEEDFRWTVPMKNLSEFEVPTPDFKKNPPAVDDVTSSSIYDTSANFYFEPRSRVIIKNVFPGHYSLSVYTNGETRIRTWMYAPGQWDGMYDGKPWMPISYNSMPQLQVNRAGNLSGRREWYYSSEEPPHYTNAIDFFTISNPFEENTIKMVGLLKRTDFLVREKYIAGDSEDIVAAAGYQSTSRMLNWGERPEELKDYVKTIILKCDDPDGMKHLDVSSVDLSDTGENTKEIRFSTYGMDVYSYNIYGLMPGNYEMSEKYFAPYTTGIDSARYRSVRNEYDVSFKDYFVDNTDPDVDIYNHFKNNGNGTAEAIMFDNKYSLKFRIAPNTNDFGDGMTTDDAYRIIIPDSHVVDNTVEKKYNYNRYYTYDYYQIANDNSCYTRNYKNGSTAYQELFIIKKAPTIHYKVCWVPVQFTPAAKTYYYEDIHDSLFSIAYASKKPISDKKYYIKNGTGEIRMYEGGLFNYSDLRTADMNGLNFDQMEAMGYLSNEKGNNGYAETSNNGMAMGIKVYAGDNYLGYVTWPAHDGTTNLGGIVVDSPAVALPGWLRESTNLQEQTTKAYDLEGKPVYTANRTKEFDKTRDCAYTKNSVTDASKPPTFRVPVKSRYASGDNVYESEEDIYGTFSIPGTFNWEDLDGDIIYGISRDYNKRYALSSAKFENEAARHCIGFGDGMTAAMFAACCMSPTYTIGFED